MSNATKNANEQIDSLTLIYNRTRQANIHQRTARYYRRRGSVERLNQVEFEEGVRHLSGALFHSWVTHSRTRSGSDAAKVGFLETGNLAASLPLRVLL